MFIPTKIVVERFDTNSGEVIEVVSDGLLSLTRALDLSAEYNALQRSVGYAADTAVYAVDPETNERVRIER